MKKAPDFDTFAILVKVDKKSEFKKTKMNLQAGLTVMPSENGIGGVLR